MRKKSSSFVQAQANRATGDRKYIDRAAKEMVLYLDKIQLENGLFYHSPEAHFSWGRGNGWMAVGMAEILRILPDVVNKYGFYRQWSQRRNTKIYERGEKIIPTFGF